MTLKKIQTLAVLLLVLPIVFKLTHQVPTDAWMRDPVQYLGGKIYVGFFSNLGALCWMAALVACAFAYQKNSDRFFLHSAWFTALLMLDDLMLIHDVLVPDVFGLPEIAVYVMYLGFAAWYFAKYKEKLFQKESWIFLVSLVFLGASVGLDCLEHRLDLATRLPAYYVWEDGLKWLGIVHWACFFWQKSLKSVI